MPSVYEIITDRVIAALELGEIPWRRPWVTVDGAARSRKTGKPYSLLNQMLLTHGAGEYATARQWKELGGSIKDGEHAEIIVFWKWPEKTQEEAEDKEQEKRREKPVLRYYHVYHISQIDGVEPLVLTFLINSTNNVFHVILSLYEKRRAISWAKKLQQ